MHALPECSGVLLLSLVGTAIHVPVNIAFSNVVQYWVSVHAVDGASMDGGRYNACSGGKMVFISVSLMLFDILVAGKSTTSCTTLQTVKELLQLSYLSAHWGRW